MLRRSIQTPGVSEKYWAPEKNAAGNAELIFIIKK
jgi:hypothetical protein